MDGMCHDIASMQYIDLNKPYWDWELSRAINFGDNMLTVIGMADLTAIDFLTVLMFNKSIVERYQIENLYTAVREGRWTFDKMGELGAMVTDDINGDGTLNNQDQYGVLGGTKYLHCSFIPAANAWYIAKDAENIPVFTMASDEHIYDVYEKTLQILNDNNAWYKTTDWSNEQNENCEMFRAGQGLFLGHQIYFVASMRDMENDFGLLPYPKYNEEQDNYYSRLCFYDTTVIPVTAADPECSSIILEAFTCDAFNNLIPVYKEQLLKSKFVRDADSAEMFDLMLEHRIADMGDSIYYAEIRDGIMAGMFMNSDRTLASKVKVMEKVVRKRLDKTRERITEK